MGSLTFSIDKLWMFVVHDDHNFRQCWRNSDPDICGALSDKCSGAGDWRDESFWKIKGHLGHSLRYVLKILPCICYNKIKGHLGHSLRYVLKILSCICYDKIKGHFGHSLIYIFNSIWFFLVMFQLHFHLYRFPLFDLKIFTVTLLQWLYGRFLRWGLLGKPILKKRIQRGRGSKWT